MSRVRKTENGWKKVADIGGSGGSINHYGTRAEFEEQKDDLPVGSAFDIIDDGESSPIEYDSTNSIAFIKIGRMVTMLFVNLNTLTYGTNGLVANCPDKYKPLAYVSTTTKIYNGSAYVDCNISVAVTGEIQIRDVFGSAISGARVPFLQTRSISWISAN